MACLHEPTTAEVAFWSFVTSRENLTEWLERGGRKVVVIEALGCGNGSGPTRQQAGLIGDSVGPRRSSRPLPLGIKSRQ